MLQTDTENSEILLQRALEREREARCLAEQLLEQKSRDLFLANQMIHQMVQMTAEVDSFEKALQECIDTVCKTIGWPIGHAYVKHSKTGTLEPTDIWYPQNLQGLDQCQKIKTDLSQKALESQSLVWINEYPEDLPISTRETLARLNVQGMIDLPIKIGSEVVAVLEFFLHTEINPDQTLLNTMKTISQQLSSVIERKGYQKALKLANSALDAKIQARTQELLSANQHLEEELLERRRLESQLVQSEKMASLGQLAAGIAHEINNPIGFIMSNLGTLEEYLSVLKRLILLYGNADNKTETKIKEEVLLIHEQEDLNFILEDVDNLLMESKEGINRVKEIVQNLKSFSRVDEGELKETDINECIETTLKIVWNEIKYNCQVFKEYGDLPIICAYSGLLNQVFMNLLVNAAQAIPEQGEIHIHTELVDKAIMIRILDTGEGIPEDKLSQIFDPFFTTKPVGKGTGLGLSIVYGIIQKHHGTISVESELQKGTIFTITLPVERDNV